MSKFMTIEDLPAPRLQLRWERQPENSEYRYVCFYELVIPLNEGDIRREVWEDGVEVGSTDVKVIEINSTGRKSSSPYPPCTAHPGGHRFADTPYRDGAHAMFDAKHLGNPPIFVVAPDGMVFELTKSGTQGRGLNVNHHCG